VTKVFTYYWGGLIWSQVNKDPKVFRCPSSDGIGWWTADAKCYANTYGINVGLYDKLNPPPWEPRGPSAVESSYRISDLTQPSKLCLYAERPADKNAYLAWGWGSVVSKWQIDMEWLGLNPVGKNSAMFYYYHHEQLWNVVYADLHATSIAPERCHGGEFWFAKQE